MSIYIANDGDVTVDTIAERNNLTRKFDGMQVTVRDATGDPAIGQGFAEYQWDAQSSKWFTIWSEYKSTIEFIIESKNIIGNTVTATHDIQDGVIWSGLVIDPVTSYVLGDASILSVSGKTITLTSNDYDGKVLKFNYAKGTVDQQLASYVNDSVGSIADFEGDLE